MKLNEALSRSRKATKDLNIRFVDFPEGYEPPKKDYIVIVLAIILIILIALGIFLSWSGANIHPNAFDLILRPNFA